MSTPAPASTDSEPVDREPSASRPPAPVAVRWLLGLALVYTLQIAQSLLVPVLVALLLALLMSPVVDLLKRLHIPRSLSALLILGALCGPLTLLAIELAQPAQKWAQRIPELSSFMSEQLDALTPEPPPAPAPAPVPEVVPAEPEKTGFNFWGWFSDDKPEPTPPPTPVPEPQPAPTEKTSAEVVSDKIVESGMEAAFSLLLATPVVIAQMLTCLILFLFLVILGPRFFQIALEQSARVKDKRRAIVLVVNLRRHLSRYIVTVSIINSCVGAATALAFWWMGVEDALLWGVLIAVLNFAPYIGPLLSVGILCLAGLAQYGPEFDALMPAIVYLALNLLESQLVTPMVLGRNMRLNPLVVVLWLIIWGWLWGATGVLLAVPLLVCIKLVGETLQLAPGLIRVLESE